MSAANLPYRSHLLRALVVLHRDEDHSGEARANREYQYERTHEHSYCESRSRAVDDHIENMPSIGDYERQGEECPQSCAHGQMTGQFAKQ